MRCVDALTLQERTRRLSRRLNTLQQLFEWASVAEPQAPLNADEFWCGLSGILGDLRADVAFLRRMPFPLTEWHGEDWRTFARACRPKRRARTNRPRRRSR